MALISSSSSSLYCCSCRSSTIIAAADRLSSAPAMAACPSTSSSSNNAVMFSTSRALKFSGFRRSKFCSRIDAVVSEEQPLTAVVSQYDKLTLFFKAEGKLDEKLTPSVTRALEAVDSVSNVEVKTVEGITIVELVKETSIQDTGVSSGLVETLQRLGFKLHNLSLCFEDEEDKADESIFSLGLGNVTS